MNEKPKLRSFRFRLSTVLILTAIAAWGKSLPPFLEERPVTYYRQVLEVPPGAPIAYGPEVKVRNGEPPPFRHGYQTPHDSRRAWEKTLAPQLRYPLLALAAFLSWKAAWAVVEPRREVKRLKLRPAK
ncbi:MAG: hypothetical protein K2Y37_08155 [Pirellulales bacterium]|nr:hypothetical protein [Pirellulales bacterium]